MAINTEKILGLSLILILLVGAIVIFSTQQTVNKYQYKKEFSVDSKKLFDLLADVKNYPEIFPENIKSVKILNQTDNTIFTEETILLQGKTRVIEVKHEIKPYRSHTIIVLSGELKNTSFIINFHEENSKTHINIKAEVWFPAYLGFFVNNGPTGLNNFNQLINQQVIRNFIQNV